MVIEDINQIFIPGLSVGKAAFLSECAVSCLSRQGHISGVPMECKGIISAPEALIWSTPFDAQLERSTEDLQETTEHGAECISALFALEHTPYTIVKRARKKTGVDYWLGNKEDNLFHETARLEISGIMSGKSEVTKRKNQKLKQTNPSDSTALPAFISIVEFGTPIIEFVQK